MKVNLEITDLNGSTMTFTVEKNKPRKDESIVNVVIKGGSSDGRKRVMQHSYDKNELMEFARSLLEY